MLLFTFYLIIESATLGLGIWILYQTYYNGEVRNKKRNIIYIGILGIIYFVHIFNMWNSYVSNISVLIESIALGVLVASYFHVRARKVIAIELLYWINISLFKLPILVYEGLKYNINVIEVNRDEYLPIEAVWSAFVFIIICFLYLKNKTKLSRFFRKIADYWKLDLLVCFIQWCLLTYIMWLGIHKFEEVDLLLNISLLFISQIYLQYLLLKLTQQEVEAENQRLDTAMGILQKSNNELQSIYNHGREQTHEVYHNILYVYHCLKDKKTEEAEKVLESYISTYQKLNTSVWTGLPFLDFIINYKKDEMDRKNIRVELFLNVFEYPMEDVELGILLGNLLDNAIEACEKCDKEKRFIKLKIKNFKHTFVLSLSNSCIEKAKQINGRCITSKMDKNDHGMGVEQVKRRVNNYGGEIDFQNDCDHFVVNIIISQ